MVYSSRRELVSSYNCGNGIQGSLLLDRGKKEISPTNKAASQSMCFTRSGLPFEGTSLKQPWMSSFRPRLYGLDCAIICSLAGATYHEDVACHYCSKTNSEVRFLLALAQ